MVIGKEITWFEAVDKRAVVTYFYLNEDSKFHHEVHKRKGTAEDNIQDTLDSISENSVMYEVKVGHKLAAFFVRYEDEMGNLCLEGFHVGKRFRKAWFLNQFWVTVKRIFCKEFVTGICQSNEQAIRHLLKQGFVIINKKVHNDNIFFILKSE